MNKKVMMGFCAVGLGMLSSAHSAIVLNSATGPIASYNQAFDFTALGTAGYVFYGNSASGVEKTGYDGLFSELTNSSGGILAPGSNSSDRISSVSFTDGTPTTTATNATSFLYGVPDNSSFAVGQGVSFTFAIGARHVSLNLYAVSYTATGLLTATQGLTELYSDTPGVALPSSNGNHGAGIYTFDLTGSDPGDTVTFNYTSVSGTSGYVNVGIQGATVSLVPEPTSLSLAALGALFLLKRRRGV